MSLGKTGKQRVVDFSQTEDYESEIVSITGEDIFP